MPNSRIRAALCFLRLATGKWCFIHLFCCQSIESPWRSLSSQTLHRWQLQITARTDFLTTATLLDYFLLWPLVLSLPPSEPYILCLKMCWIIRIVCEIQKTCLPQCLFFASNWKPLKGPSPIHTATAHPYTGGSGNVTEEGQKGCGEGGTKTCVASSTLLKKTWAQVGRKWQG